MKIFTLLLSFNLSLSDATPPLVTTSDSPKRLDALSLILIFLGIAICAIIIALTVYFHKKDQQKDNNAEVKHNQAVKESQGASTPQQVPIPVQQTAPQTEQRHNHGFLTFLGVVFLIILIIGGIVFVSKCAINKATDGETNTDGNPVLLNRAATINDFTLTESIEASITNLKESYILVPNVDIKNLEITFKYYDSSNNLVSTKTKIVGDVTKSSEYTVSIEHSLSEILKISKVSYYVSGGTVSYFK